MPFAIDNVLTARVDLPRADYPDSRREHPVLRAAAAAAPRRCPASKRRRCPTGSRRRATAAIPVQIAGKAYARDSDYPLAREGIVTPGYFETFQTAVLGGREFTPATRATGQPVAIVNESFARAHFPGVDPLGRSSSASVPARTSPG